MLRAPHSPKLKLLVLGANRMSSFPLPRAGDVVLGRAQECHVAIDDPSVAPRHALLRLGPPMTIVDLGHGKTTVGKETLARGVERGIGVGVVFFIGAVTVVVQSAQASTRLRHVRTHDYFEGRLEDECARVDATGGSFALIRIRCALEGAPFIEEAMSTTLRPMDVVAIYSPYEYEILFVDVMPSVAERMAERLRDEVTTAGITVEVGLSCYPRDARTPEALLSHAGDALRGVVTAPAPSLSVDEDAMARLRPIVERVAKSAISVLLLGETGVGKEVMAHAIHAMSPRATKPMVCINCASLTETLLESELFGFERGAFTGAHQAKAGLLESANGGSVLLDEIGEMPLSLQAKLLRVIEQKQVTRIGAVAPRPVDARFIAATNRDLDEEVERNRFRRDLYFRLNGISLFIPPLRERVNEIESLARTFVAQFATQAGRPPPTISADTMELLESYAWPGNIRELRNVMERAVLLCTGDVIDRTHLPAEKMGRMLPQLSRVSQPPPSYPAPVAAPHEAPVEDDDRRRLVSALEMHGGNQTQAAKALGIARRTLIHRLERYGLPRPRKRDN